MLFDSFPFAVFLPVVFAAYWAIGRANVRAQNALLVLASYVFYGWWDVRFLSLIVLSSAIDYAVGRGLHSARDDGRRRMLLAVSLLVNLGLLGVFKYYDFFVTSMADMLTSAGVQANPSTLRIVLPVGISFYTFQTLSYSIDVYRRRIEPTRDTIAFFAFVSFFPQLVAGPIERAARLLPQFTAPRRFDAALATDGMRQILWGLVKKMVVADNVALTVDRVFADPGAEHPLVVLAGVFLFAVQIYGDFSGYSDIAIGTARLFGFSLMRNFAFPYFARDVAEFWRRWHISLSTWFRDYVYIPIGGSHGGRVTVIRNVLITFGVSGLWHGANWTFVVWGLLNGLAYVPLLMSDRQRAHEGTVAPGRLLPSVGDGLRIVGTFAFTLAAWVFFRAESLGHAFDVFEAFFLGPWSGPLRDGLTSLHVAYGLLLLGFEWTRRDREHALQFVAAPAVVRRTVYVILVVTILVLGHSGDSTFIYFQF